MYPWHLQDYGRARTDTTITKILGELGAGGEVFDLVVHLEEITVQ
jgi:hypothetical protein